MANVYFTIPVQRNDGTFESIWRSEWTRRDAIALVREALSEGRTVKFVHEHIDYADGSPLNSSDITDDMIEEARMQMLQAAE